MRFLWTLRKKPLEAFLMPVAAAEGRLLCRDCSLVSMFRVEGARSADRPGGGGALRGVGGADVEQPVHRKGARVACDFSRGSRMRACWQASATRCAGGASNSASKWRTCLGERAAARAPAVERFLLACWTRPSAASSMEAKSDKRRRKYAMKGWIAAAGESQCAVAGLDSLVPRHDALMDAVGGLFEEAGIVAERLSDEDMLAAVRRGVDGFTGPGWRGRTAGDDPEPRVTEPAELGALPPPLAPQLLGSRSGADRRGRRDRQSPLRHARYVPRAEEREAVLRTARSAGGLSVQESPLLAEGGGLGTLGAQAAKFGASFLAFSSDESHAVRKRDGRHGGDRGQQRRRVVRLRVSIATWVPRGGRGGCPSPADEPGAAARRGLGRVACFRPLAGDPLEALAGTIAGFCCGGTAPGGLRAAARDPGVVAGGTAGALCRRGRTMCSAPRTTS